MLEQLDIKTVFLHGILEEIIDMQQLKEFVKEEGKVCLLEKLLYGLKQCSRKWYKRFDDFITQTGF